MMTRVELSMMSYGRGLKAFENLNPIVERISDQEQEGTDEVQRLIRLAKIALRPQQSEFRMRLRELYQDRCAITRCRTAAVLEAAHIRVIRRKRSVDDSDLRNGILLRADIHALFDVGLITLTEDGSRVQANKELGDPLYDFLNEKEVFRPDKNAPSIDNIRHHRKRFNFAVSA
jgi:hypothetical protein